MFVLIHKQNIIEYLVYIPGKIQSAQLPIFSNMFLFFWTLPIKTYNILYFAKIILNAYILDFLASKKNNA